MPRSVLLAIFYITSTALATAEGYVGASRLLAITPGATTDSIDSLKTACAALSECGVHRLLLREPHLSRRQVERLVDALLPLFPSGTLLLHEKCEGARAIAAAKGIGLHLASTSDWHVERERFSGLLGASAHSEAEAELAAECGLDWVFLSPVARPTSKPGDDRPPLGEAAFLRAQRALPAIDLYALGGVTPASASRLAAGGGRGVAVLGGIFLDGATTSHGDAHAAASAYMDALHAPEAWASAAASSRE